MFKNKTAVAINDYLKGMSYRDVGEKYKVNHKTVRYWVIKSGNKSRSNKEANLLAGKRLKGVRRSPNTEFKKGQSPWNDGTVGATSANKTSFKKGERPSVATEFKKGPEHPCYIDGMACRPYPTAFNNKLKRKIRKRDNYKCQNCGMTEKEHLVVYTKRLSLHHIDYNKDNNKENNLISLCNGCHSKTNFNRGQWENIFKKREEIDV